MLRVRLTAVTVMMTGGPGGLLDWIGLYQAGANDQAWTDWKRMSGTKSPPLKGLTTAFIAFALPRGGPFELRMFGGTGYSTPLGIWPIRQPLSAMSNELTAAV